MSVFASTLLRSPSRSSLEWATSAAVHPRTRGRVTVNLMFIQSVPQLTSPLCATKNEISCISTFCISTECVCEASFAAYDVIACRTLTFPQPRMKKGKNLRCLSRQAGTMLPLSIYACVSARPSGLWTNAAISTPHN
jgi:hypothetical protein